MAYYIDPSAPRPISTNEQVRESYDKVADQYASKFLSELDSKPLDRVLLKDFISSNGSKGRIIDLGCGPGQTTRFLMEHHSACCVLGTDLSPAMIQQAKQHHADVIGPRMAFEVADMLSLQYPAAAFQGANAFYSIVNFDYPQITQAFKEIARVLAPGGQFLCSFHVGTEVRHFDAFFDQPVDLNFFFLLPDRITEMLQVAGFKIITSLVRQPYEGEHPSQRAYILAERL